MSKHDGSVTFSTALDNEKLEKELQDATKKIEAMEAKLYQDKQKRLPIQKQLDQLTMQADAAAAKLEEMRNASAGTYTNEQITAQAETARALGARWEQIHTQLQKCDADIQGATEKLNMAKEKAGGIARELAKAGKNTAKMDIAVKKAQKSMDRFVLRLREVVRSALVFTLITQSLAKFREWMGKIIKTNSEASAAVAKLKGALLTLAQPLVDVIIPAFTTLVTVLAKVISVAAQLMSYLFGKTAKQSAESAEALYEETQALEGVGDAADKAKGSLAAFDEINTLSNNSTSSSEAIEPDFNLETELPENQLQNILGLVTAIGIGFLSWKLSSALGGGLSNVGGSLLFIVGAVELVKSIFDAWTNGVSWENLQGSIFGLTATVAGLSMLFGPTAAGIGAIVGGLVMLVTGFKDAMESGWSLENMLMSVAGVIATGLGISILTGSLIPAVVAGIGAILLAITVATGHGEELLGGVKQMLNGFKDFFIGIFTGDMESAMSGLSDIFGGLKLSVDAILKGVRDLFLGFFDWLDEKTGGKLHGILMFMKGLFSGTFDAIRTIVSDVVDAVHQILGGLVTFISGVFTGDWDKAWEGVKSIFKGVFNGVVGILEGAVNLIIKGINWLISQLNKISFTLPSWVPGIGGKSIGIDIPAVSELQIPRLATGSVIPPNREFLAVLGDNKTETEVVSPLSTMKQAMIEALRESGGSGGNITITVKAAPGMARYLKYEIDSESARRGGKLVGGAVK